MSWSAEEDEVIVTAVRELGQRRRGPLAASAGGTLSRPPPLALSGLAGARWRRGSRPAPTRRSATGGTGCSSARGCKRARPAGLRRAVRGRERHNVDMPDRSTSGAQHAGHDALGGRLGRRHRTTGLAHLARSKRFSLDFRSVRANADMPKTEKNLQFSWVFRRWRLLRKRWRSRV